MNQQSFQQVGRNSPEAIPTEMRRIEGREWWLLGFAVAVTLALTLGSSRSPFPGLVGRPTLRTGLISGNGYVGWQLSYYFSTFTRSISTCNSTAFGASWLSEISFFNSSAKTPPIR